MEQNEAIKQILDNCRSIAVVGLSPRPQRDSFKVARVMQAHGYRIIPINPNASEILGEPAYPSLLEAARHERIDLVNCFRHSTDIPPIVDDAIAIGAKAVWLQLGIENAAAAAKAQGAGLLVVQDKCLKLEYARLSATIGV